MSENTCPKCGRPLDEGQPCSNCLLRLAASPISTLAARDLSGVADDTSDWELNNPKTNERPEIDLETLRNAFPHLEIIETIGRGGMGYVFKARQPKLDRFVALKILSTDLETKPGFAERFAQEGKLLARLNHQNIVAVHDFGESGGFYYLMMEHVDGVNLRQAMREKRFTPEQAIAIVPKICDALQYAHDEGVLHRDIKPENILLDTKGRVKIADFGIAKLYAKMSPTPVIPATPVMPATPVIPAEAGIQTKDVNPVPLDPRLRGGDGGNDGENIMALTQTGQVLGTLAYMAPEQLEDAQRADHRADIYSLGVVFYELLTGELPRGHFPAPSERTSVSADIDNVVMKALHKEREKRQQSAEELKTAIEATRTPKPQTGAVKDFPHFIRALLALAVVLVGMAVLLLVSFNWEYLTGAAKLTIVGSALAAAHAGGFCLRKTGWKGWADGAFFFAGIMYGVGIWQVGQVFHIPADVPMLFWLWAVGAFLLALVVGTTTLHLLSVALLTAWMIAAMTGFFDPRHVFLFGLGLVPFFAWSLPFFAVVGIGACALKQKSLAAALYVLLLGFWWVLQGWSSGLGPHLTFHIVALGLLFVALASYRFRSIDNDGLERVGFLLIAGGLVAPSFLGHWGWLLHANVLNNPDITGNRAIYLFWVFALPVINLVILLGLFRWKNRSESVVALVRRNKTVLAWIAVLFVLWIGSYIVSLVMNPCGGQRFILCRTLLLDDPLALGGMFAVNVLIVWMAVGLIWNGLKRNHGSLFWSGVMFFLLWAMIRYFDLFSEFGGMLGTAAIFLFCGLFLLGIVYFWTAYRHKFRITEFAMDSPQELALPVWATTISDKLSPFLQSERNILTAAVIVALLQFGILGAMIANEMRPHIAATTGTGTTIRVLTAPVDPRDLFRGDYVILRYEFSDAHAVGFNVEHASEQTVFVTMQQEGELWRATGFSQTRPREGIFLRGVVRPHSRTIVYGIESYFVQEGTGRAIEDAMRRDRESVVVELVVAPDGKASIRAVHVE